MTTPFTHETLPADPKAAIRQMKQALRAQIGDVQAVFDRLSATIAARVAEINDLKAQGSRYGQLSLLANWRWATLAMPPAPRLSAAGAR